MYLSYGGIIDNHLVKLSFWCALTNSIAIRVETFSSQLFFCLIELGLLLLLLLVYNSSLCALPRVVIITTEGCLLIGDMTSSSLFLRDRTQKTVTVAVSLY